LEKTNDTPARRHRHDPLSPCGRNSREEAAAVIIQADNYNAKLTHFIVAEITKNLAAASDPASFFIDISTLEGIATGLEQNSVVCCLFLATVSEPGITKVIGKLSATMKVQLDACLKTAIQL
jgi:mRNA-degrading endonuclease toxin of MazEF toxin-antitoxin module